MAFSDITGTVSLAHGLTPRQIAYVRCWAEGLDLREAWKRYLHADGVADARRARGELQRLLDELRGQARARGRPDIAALLRRDPEAIVDRGPSAPTLDEFRDTVPADYYSEAELLSLYEAQFGAAESRSPARRRQRLRERLVLALSWLERQEERVPQRAEPVAAWFDERVARRLAMAGIERLDQLMFRIASQGFRWYRQVPRLGPAGAARIVHWLRSHERSLGALPRPALLPARQIDTRALTPAPRAGIVPLERFVLPAALDGRQGSRRAPAPSCRLPVSDDLEAVRAWLALREAGSHTWRSYRKEAERFLLWAVLERGKALSSLDGADCLAFCAFLADPGTDWTGPRNAQRWSEAWRPFERGLAPRSQALAVAALRSLCRWLVQQAYMVASPWDELPATTARPSPAAAPLRAFTAAQWAKLRRWVDRQAPCPAQRRLLWALELAHATGLRRSELVAARLGWLQATEPPGRGLAWSIQVRGPQGAQRRLALPTAAVEIFRECLTDRGLATRILSNEPGLPLIAHLEGGRALSSARLYEVLANAFRGCADDLTRTDPQAAERLRAASTHWLRHSHGAEAASHGVSRAALQAALGHRRPATVAVYFRHRAENQRQSSTAGARGEFSGAS